MSPPRKTRSPERTRARRRGSRAASAAPAHLHPALQLQRAAGNAAVRGLLAQEQASPAGGVHGSVLEGGVWDDTGTRYSYADEHGDWAYHDRGWEFLGPPEQIFIREDMPAIEATFDEALAMFRRARDLTLDAGGKQATDGTRIEQARALLRALEKWTAAARRVDSIYPHISSGAGRTNAALVLDMPHSAVVDMVRYIGLGHASAPRWDTAVVRFAAARDTIRLALLEEGAAESSLVAAFNTAIWNLPIGAGGFVLGFVAGFGEKSSVRHAGRLLKSIGLRPWLMPLMPPAFVVGTGEGIYRDVKSSLEMVAKLLTDFDKVVGELLSSISLFMGPEAGEIGWTIGAEAGRAAFVNAQALIDSPLKLAREAGKLVGPMIVLALLSACGIPVAVAGAAQQLVEVLKRSKLVAALARRIRQLVRVEALAEAELAGVGRFPPRVSRGSSLDASAERRVTKASPIAESSADPLYRTGRGMIAGKVPVAPSAVRVLVGESRSAFRRRLSREIADPGNDLHFLLDETGRGGRVRGSRRRGRRPRAARRLRNTTRKGMTKAHWLEDPRLVEAGHIMSDKIGGRRVILMSAHKNRLLSATVEGAPGGAVLSVPYALEIGGFAVDVELALDWYAAKLISAKTLTRAPLIDLTRL